jgi:ABC-type sugar transport system ATPase subunit
MDTVRLRIDKISKRFPGVQALKQVDFNLKKGEVHALIGENGAGKSTLMKIILGIYPPSEGEMFLDNQKYIPHSPLDARNKGISMIHQEISLVNSMPVFENVWLGNEPKFGSPLFSKKKRMIAATRQILDNLNMDIDPEEQVNRLTISKMQMVEIVRAISSDSSIIIMDEPSSSLTDAEMEKLFLIIRDLKAKGKSIIYISHKMDEIFRICDSVTVFRDGQYVAEREVAKVTKNELVNLMVARELSEMYPKVNTVIGDAVLEVKNFFGEGKFDGINFSVKAGEILGFCGLVGAGRTEIMQAIFGLDSKDSGNVFLRGKALHIKNSYDAIQNGIALVTEDRRGNGMISGLSVKINTTLAYLIKVSKLGFLNKNLEGQACKKILKLLAVKTPSEDTLMSMLSGGNQQKIIIGKWLLTEPDVLILDEPTRGIDVGAKAEIYKLMGNIAVQGKAIIMVSSELPELLGICDRIFVVYQGRIVDEFSRENFDQELIMKSAFGLKQSN